MKRTYIEITLREIGLKMEMVSCKQQIKQITVPTPFAVGDVHTYVIIGERVTLVDAGVKTNEAWDVFTKELKKHGLHTRDIDQIFITHHHPDHVGLVDFFPNNVPIIGHKRSQPWMIQNKKYIQTHEDFYLQILQESGVDARFFPMLKRVNDILKYSSTIGLTSFIEEGESLVGLENWKVFETPGHASSHLVLFDEESGTLIGGDLILDHISPNPLIEPPYEGETERKKPLLDYVDSIHKMMELPIQQVLPGHGRIVTNVQEHLQDRLTKQEKRSNKVFRYLEKQRSSTAYEVCQYLFPQVFEKQLMLTMSETIGQLDYLENKGKIKVDRSKMPFQYEVLE